MYNGIIDVSNIEAGETFELQYGWNILTDAGFEPEGGAYASFYDPIGDVAGFSVDHTGITAVPEPATELMMFAAVGSLARVAAGRRSHRDLKS